MALAAKVLSVVQPLLKFLYTLPFIGYYIDLFALFVAAAMPRFASGHYVADGIAECRRPKKLLKLYEYEGCPFCRKVRETLCVLDLDVMIMPCPRETFRKNGFVKDSRYRPAAIAIGKKCQFPLLVDENEVNDENEPLFMYESDKIIAYLWKTYGDKANRVPSYILGSSQFSFVLLMITSVLRCFPEHGLIRIPSKKPKQLLELWSFEPSPFCKKVREILCSLEIAYISRNAARGSLKRKEFREKYGDKLSIFRDKAGIIQVVLCIFFVPNGHKIICLNHQQVPLLIDPNTNVVMLESEDIKQYLSMTYQDGEFNTDECMAQYLEARSKKSD